MTQPKSRHEEIQLRLIHEGKVKRVYADPESEERLIVEFTDAITAGDGAKKEILEGKGTVACDTTEFLLKFLESKGIETHFIKRLDGPKLLCKKASMYPIESVCRNVVAGSFARRYGLETGRSLSRPLVEFFLKDDDLHDPMIAKEAVIRLGIATEEELAFMRRVTLAVNYYLGELFSQVGLRLVDFKLEFGKTSDGKIVVADEISGDTMRVWDKNSQSMDKDIFRKDLGDVVEIYRRLLEKLSNATPESILPLDEVIDVVVMPKEGIKNPPGEVAKKALVRLGYDEILDVRVGKVFRITMSTSISGRSLDHVDEMAEKLLANPIAETTRVRLD
ncbi:MAG: phosphoribosylaminoimidazolesuccinocarboxamide synthase [Candidatus Thorarchaeota archaeon]|nr:phosphoribosylaminoimidazolesuccinocarboxamide synthase [Candidatus Thorarchaeota archaeon]